MYSVKYQKSGSVNDAVEGLLRCPDAKVLAGGQSLVAAMKLRMANPELLIDLGPLDELRGISMDALTVTIGAMTRHADVAASAELLRTLPALAGLAGGIGDRMVRNMGTLGGSVAHNDPAADYPAALLALDATVVTNQRRIPADEFFVGLYETALEPGEIIVSVVFRVPRRAAYIKFKSAASRFAIVGVFVADFGSAVRVAVTGAGHSVFRVQEMEEALQRDFSAAAIADIHLPAQDLSSDPHTSAEYRAHLVTELTKRAVDTARGEAGG